MVRVKGLEPPRIAAPDPKSGVSTNFTTPASFEGRKVTRFFSLVNPEYATMKTASSDARSLVILQCDWKNGCLLLCDDVFKFLVNDFGACFGTNSRVRFNMAR